MGCFGFIGDILGFSIVRKGLKSHPVLTWSALLAFWSWAFITGAMVVRYAHLGEHPYVFELMPIASCFSPVVALIGVLLFTIGDAFTNVFSEAFQSSFGFMPFDLYKLLGQPHPLLTWGAYVRLNLVGLMSYALLPGLMGRLFSRLMKGLIGAIMPKRKQPAAVYADGPREFDPNRPPTGPREYDPTRPSSGPREMLPGEAAIDPPPGMKPGDIMVNMGPDSPGQVIRDGVVIQGEGLGTRVDMASLGGMHTAGSGTLDAPPGSLPGDIMVNMGPDSPGQVIRNGVVIAGEGVGTQVGLPPSEAGMGLPPGARDGDIMVNMGPDSQGQVIRDGQVIAGEGAGVSGGMDLSPGARDGDIMVNMGADSQGQVIRDGRVIAGEGAGSRLGPLPGEQTLGNAAIGSRGRGGPVNEGDIPLNSAADLNGSPGGGPRDVNDIRTNSFVGGGAGGDSAAGLHGGMGSLADAGLGSHLSSTGAGSHAGIGYAPNAGLGSQLAGTGSMAQTGLGGVLGQAGVSATVSGAGSGYLVPAVQGGLSSVVRADQLAGLSQVALQGQGGALAEAIATGGRRRPRGPKPGWGHEPYRPPWQPQDPRVTEPDFYGSGGGPSWHEQIPGYIGAVVGTAGGIGLGGGIYYGDMWAEYHPIRELTHPSGSPDPSCFKMDADYAVQNVAAGGTMSPVGGAAVTVTGATPPPPSGPATGGGSGGTGTGPGSGPATQDTIEWTSPDGRTHVLEKQPNGNYINILTGGEVAADNIDGWKQTYNDNLQRTDDWRQRNEYLTSTGQDAQSQELAAIKAEHAARQKLLDDIGRMERNVFEGRHGLGDLMRPGEPGDIMKNLRDLAHQAMGRDPVDLAKLNAVQRLYTDTITGTAVPHGELPGPESETQVIMDGTMETVKQWSTLRGPDGKFSATSLVGRIGADILTLGYAEGLFIPAESLHVAKDYVDAGGDSALVGGLMAAGTAAVNLVGGEVVTRGLKAAPAIARVGGELADELAEGVVQSARSGNSMAQTAVNIAQGAQRAGTAVRGVYDAYGRPIVNGLKQGLDEINIDLGRAPWEPPPGPGRIARPPVTNADVNSRSASFINDPAANIGQQVDNMPAHTRTGLQEVADEHGVLIDMRPGNEATARRIQEGCHPKGPDLHNKTINSDDLLLGANPNGEGLVGHYKPQLPENFDSLSRPDQLRIIDRFQQRHAEFVNNHAAISRNPKFEIRDGVIYNRETGLAYTGDNDAMAIRDAVTGRMASAEQTNAVMNDLVGRNIGVEHNAHMNWNYRGQPTTPQGPRVEFTGTAQSPGAISGEWRQSPFQQSQNIDHTIINSHQLGARGSRPLVTFQPGGPPRATFIRGGCLR